MERVEKFLKEAGTYYLATVDGDQPRVRPFGTVNNFEGKLYIQTGKSKDVSKQLHANPKCEICAFKDGDWIRIACELAEDDRRERRQIESQETFGNPACFFGIGVVPFLRCLDSRYSYVHLMVISFSNNSKVRRCMVFAYSSLNI